MSTCLSSAMVCRNSTGRSAARSTSTRACTWVVDTRVSDAGFTEQTTRITAFALMGGIDIVVPEDAEVRARGLGIMGVFSGRRTTAPVRPRRQSSS
jgi:hypothetical protein